MSLITQELNITTPWSGTLAGVLLKSSAATTDGVNEKTTKIIGVHGWLDNLNSLLPLSQKLIDLHPSKSYC